VLGFKVRSQVLEFGVMDLELGIKDIRVRRELACPSCQVLGLLNSRAFFSFSPKKKLCYSVVLGCVFSLTSDLSLAVFLSSLLQPMKVIGNGCFGKVMMVKFKKNGIFICLTVLLASLTECSPCLNPRP